MCVLQPSTAPLCRDSFQIAPSSMLGLGSLLFCLGCNSQVSQLGLQRGLVKAEASFLCAEGLQVTVEKKQSFSWHAFSQCDLKSVKNRGPSSERRG